MPSQSLSLRYFLPLVATSLAWLALGAATAVALFREQASSTAELDAAIATDRAAADLEENLSDLVAVLRDRSEGVAALNERTARHLAVVTALTGQTEQADLVTEIAASFNRYLQLWQVAIRQTGAAHQAAVRAALATLEADAQRRSVELREWTATRVDAARSAHQAVLQRLAWGLAGTGGMAGLAGLFLGLGAARGLSRTIRRIRVRVEDAAGLLGQELPAVELVGGGTLDELDRQVQALVGRVAEVVQTLQQREREVRRADQLAAVGQLAAGMAHEIRNPMTSIQMLVQDARENPDRGLAPDDLAVIEREVRRVERTLQTFLDYARPPRPAKAATDLAALARATLELTRGRAAKQHVRMAVTAPDRPLVVDADAGQLRQVLVNLLLNALDALPGGGEVAVALAAEPGAAVIRVTDTGPGIDPAVRARLFEPFASTRDTGLGLGLVISRRIVEDHGGTITADAAPGGGARFTVRLPRPTQPPGEP